MKKTQSTFLKCSNNLSELNYYSEPQSIISRPTPFTNIVTILRIPLLSLLVLIEIQLLVSLTINGIIPIIQLWMMLAEEPFYCNLIFRKRWYLSAIIIWFFVIESMDHHLEENIQMLDWEIVVIQLRSLAYSRQHTIKKGKINIHGPQSKRAFLGSESPWINYIEY